jgi:serine/threonine protein kinase
MLRSKEVPMNALLQRLVSPIKKRRWFAGRYRLLRRLGVGGMAEVWLAQRDDGRAVAIKRILHHLDDDSSVRLCFRDEARLGKLLQHRNLVHQLDHGYVGELPFIVFEYIDGMSLRQLAEVAHGGGTTLPLGLCLRLIAETAEALDHAHKATDDEGKPLNLVHRDISPDNILIDEHGRANLADFGVARADCNQRITANGSLCGKLAYMGPQQASAERVDHRADQFSLAVVLFELLACRRLLADTTPARTLGRILYTDLPSITEVTEGLPSRITALIDRALDRHPQARFSDCAAFATALRQAAADFETCEDESYDALLAYLTGLGGQPKPLPLATRTTRRTRARRWVPVGDHTELGFVA